MSLLDLKWVLAKKSNPFPFFHRTLSVMEVRYRDHFGNASHALTCDTHSYRIRSALAEASRLNGLKANFAERQNRIYNRRFSRTVSGKKSLQYVSIGLSHLMSDTNELKYKFRYEKFKRHITTGRIRLVKPPL